MINKSHLQVKNISLIPTHMSQYLHKKLLSFLTLCTFVISVMAPFAAAYSMTNSLPSGGNGKILICTSSGYKWVDSKDVPFQLTANTNKNAGDSESSSKTSHHNGLGCALCDHGSGHITYYDSASTHKITPLSSSVKQVVLRAHVDNVIAIQSHDAPARAPPA